MRGVQTAHEERAIRRSEGRAIINSRPFDGEDLFAAEGRAAFEGYRTERQKPESEQITEEERPKMKARQKKGPIHEKGSEYILPSGDFMIEDVNKDPKLHCASPYDAGKVVHIFGKSTGLKEDTPVFRLVNDGRRDSEIIGNVREAKEGSGYFARPELSDRLNLIGLGSSGDEVYESGVYEVMSDSDIIGDLNLTADDGVLEEEDYEEIGDDCIVARLDECITPGQTRRFHESSLFEKVFSKRKELGMNIDYFTRTNKDGSTRHDFRYRRRKRDGLAGGWVSRAYVGEAIVALSSYDKLVGFAEDRTNCSMDDLVEGWHGLKKAKGIAGKYFTDEARESADKRIEAGLDLKAGELAEYARTSQLDYRTAIQVFSRLARSDETTDLIKARDIAQNYLCGDARVALAERHSGRQKQDYLTGKIGKKMVDALNRKISSSLGVTPLDEKCVPEDEGTKDVRVCDVPPPVLPARPRVMYFPPPDLSGAPADLPVTLPQMHGPILTYEYRPDPAPAVRMPA